MFVRYLLYILLEKCKNYWNFSNLSETRNILEYTGFVEENKKK